MCRAKSLDLSRIFLVLFLSLPCMTERRGSLGRGVYALRRGLLSFVWINVCVLWWLLFVSTELRLWFFRCFRFHRVKTLVILFLFLTELRLEVDLYPLSRPSRKRRLYPPPRSYRKRRSRANMLSDVAGLIGTPRTPNVASTWSHANPSVPSPRSPFLIKSYLGFSFYSQFTNFKHSRN